MVALAAICGVRRSGRAALLPEQVVLVEEVGKPCALDAVYLISVQKGEHPLKGDIPSRILPLQFLEALAHCDQPAFFLRSIPYRLAPDR